MMAKSYKSHKSYKSYKFPNHFASFARLKIESFVGANVSAPVMSGNSSLSSANSSVSIRAFRPAR